MVTSNENPNITDCFGTNVRFFVQHRHDCYMVGLPLKATNRATASRGNVSELGLNIKLKNRHRQKCVVLQYRMNFPENPSDTTPT